MFCVIALGGLALKSRWGSRTPLRRYRVSHRWVWAEMNGPPFSAQNKRHRRYAHINQRSAPYTILEDASYPQFRHSNQR